MTTLTLAVARPRWGFAWALGAAVLALVGLRAYDRHVGGLEADLRRARVVGDSLRLVVRRDSLASAAAHDAELRTRAPHRAAIARSAAAGGRTDAQLAHLVEAQDAARRVLEDSLSGVVQLAESLRRLNDEATTASIAFLAERAEWMDERVAAARRIAALEMAAQADSTEKADLYRDLQAREREITVQDKALRCRVGPFPCPSRLVTALLSIGLTLAAVVAF